MYIFKIFYYFISLTDYNTTMISSVIITIRYAYNFVHLANVVKNIEKGAIIIYIYYMKAKEVMNKYGITRRTLSNWVKKGVIAVELTPTGRYIYIEKINLSDEKV